MASLEAYQNYSVLYLIDLYFLNEILFGNLFNFILNNMDFIILVIGITICFLCGYYNSKRDD